MANILIQGGTVYDGSGGVPEQADVLIRDGVVADVGPALSCEGARIIDARGKAVTPGFVDIHRHCDIAPFTQPDFGRIELAQGITTTVVGNCGLAPVPTTDRWREETYDYIEPVMGAIPHALRFETYAGYTEALQKAGLPLNFGFLASAGAIKTAVKGFAKTPYSAAELERAAAYVREAMDAGACGLSLGIMYQPECYSTPGENAVLARAAAERDGVLCTHIRGEGDSLVESVREVIGIADRAGIRLNISHFKSTDVRNWRDTIFKATDCIEAARARGQEVTADFYPYDGGSTTLLSLLPPSLLEENMADTFARLSTTEGKRTFREELQKTHPKWDNMALSIGWERIVVSSVTLPRHAAYQGRSVAELAQREGYAEPADFAAELMAEESGKVGIIVLSMSPEDVETVARLPYTALISDALYGGGNPHPRLYGSFPKFLREMVLEKKLMPMQTAIHKMTAMPADRAGLRDRGRIASGMPADVLVFDAAQFKDHAVYQDSRRLATGMDWVLMGGEPVWESGLVSSQRSGRVLRRS